MGLEEGATRNCCLIDDQPHLHLFLHNIRNLVSSMFSLAAPEKICLLRASHAFRASWTRLGSLWILEVSDYGKVCSKRLRKINQCLSTTLSSEKFSLAPARFNSWTRATRVATFSWEKFLLSFDLSVLILAVWLWLSLLSEEEGFSCFGSHYLENNWIVKKRSWYWRLFVNFIGKPSKFYKNLSYDFAPSKSQTSASAAILKIWFCFSGF